MLYKRRTSTNCHANMINQIDSPFTGCSIGRSIRSPRDVPFRSGCTQTHDITNVNARHFIRHSRYSLASDNHRQGRENATRLRSTFAMTPSPNTVKNSCCALPLTYYESRAIILGYFQHSFTRDIRLFTVKRREKCGCTTICVTAYDSDSRMTYAMARN